MNTHYLIIDEHAMEIMQIVRIPRHLTIEAQIRWEEFMDKTVVELGLYEKTLIIRQGNQYICQSAKFVKTVKVKYDVFGYKPLVQFKGENWWQNLTENVNQKLATDIEESDSSP
jgi:hypothetical protein